VNPELLAALGEPNRLRIVELLGAAPRSVGEIATALGLRQPQVTKHLQVLERAGAVTGHRLGQRRIFALRRETLRDLARWLTRFDVRHPSEDALEQYRAAIDAERRLAEQGGSGGRRFVLRRDVAAPVDRVWRAWTSADDVRRWWAPAHFTVVEATVVPVVGGLVRIVIAEGDGSRYPAVGRFLRLQPPTALTFELAPLDRGQPLFNVVHDLSLVARGASTAMSMTMRVSDVRENGLIALAGLRIGWEQLLDKLARLVSVDDSPDGDGR
jgi:uncharacterized protein YndB with AHSA1/START domain/DNA-binding transcriptional ArsR family regulator